MKNLYLALFISLLVSVETSAQQVGSAYLDVNNVKALFNSNGSNFWDQNQSARLFVPANSTHTAMFAQSLWIGAKDSLGNLHVASDLYGAQGFDFSSGPVSNSYDSAYDARWSKVFKIKRSTVDSFLFWYQNPSVYPSYQIPSEIMDWPAHGDVAQGQAYYLAPFKDVNNDGSYDPIQGDYPLFKGDMALWYVYNDDRSTHPTSGGAKLGVEVHVMAYAYRCEFSFDNTIYLDYNLYKRTAGTLNDVRIGIFSDFDLGYSWDDYVACDVGRSAFYCYNGTAVDGNGTPQAYGANPPAIGISILNGPFLDLDGTDNPRYTTDSLGNQIALCDWSINGSNYGDGIIDNERSGLAAFVSISNSNGPTGDPLNFYQFYSYLSGHWRDSSAILYGGNGTAFSNAYGPGCSFMYPGSSDTCNLGTGGLPPYGPNVWTEEIAGNLPSDRRCLGMTLPISNFNSSLTQPVNLEFALVWARDSLYRSVPALLDAMDTVRYYFKNNMHPCGGTFLSVHKTYEKPEPLDIKLFPNPAQNQLSIEFNQDYSGFVEVYDLTGKKLEAFQLNHVGVRKLNIQDFHKGIYFVRLSTDNGYEIKKFVKN